jgi:hypothetical protein
VDTTDEDKEEVVGLTCCSLMTSAFFNIFIAQNDPVVLCVQKRTRPNEPVPRVTPTSKSSSDNGVGRVLTAMVINQK